MPDHLPITLAVDEHPLLELRAFETRFPQPLGEFPPGTLAEWFSLSATAPLSSNDEIRQRVRDLLRHGGFKPTGRSKPASEYLLKAASEGQLAPINLAVDAGNAVSLHSGLPISVIDLDRAVFLPGAAPLRVTTARAGSSYVFNASGQTIDLGGLVCLCDADGPCANAVKDAQRTKTSPATRRTLSIIWGAKSLAERISAAEAWYRELLAAGGAETATVQSLPA